MDAPARWMGNLLGRLMQLSDAMSRGGFGDADAGTYVRAARDRINQLRNLK